MDPIRTTLAVLAAAASMFVLGGLWYSLLFAGAWQRAAGLSDDDLRAGRARAFVGTAVLALVAAASLAAFVGANGALFGLAAGAAAGITFVGAALTITALFERRRTALILIDVGYHAVAFSVMGLIVGAVQG